jgi:predicted flap endonuclease-1-like 5' DNA nuclease
MNISRSEARIKCAIFWWLLAAVIGLTVLAFLDWLGLWALVSFAAGAGTTFVMGFVLMAGFCKTDEELAAEAAANREIDAARAPYKAANAAMKVETSKKPGGDKPKAAPTVGKSAPKPAAAKPAPKAAAKPAPKPAAKAAPKPAPKPEPKPEAAPVATEQTGKRPTAMSAPRAGGADDLKKIKGVGPKLEQLCNDLGFYHYDQIAAWTADEVAWVDDNLEGFKGRVSRDDWVAQAKVLASGGETEFSKRVDDGDVY